MRRRLEQLSFTAMGTICSITVTVVRDDVRSAERALAAARAEVAACERVLSRFLPGSDLSRLNATPGAWIEVDPRLLDALDAALDARAETGGRFDPTVLPALVAVGYDRSYEQLRPRLPTPLAGWRAGAAIEIDRPGGRARLERGAAVDLGGIGKGFSAARALTAMRRAWPLMPGALVDLGGDLAIRGSAADGESWRIAVADPRAPGGRVALLERTSGGVATSGRDGRRFGPGRRFHHLIDPATGAPAADGPVAVTVAAADAASAEAHATALAITPLDRIPAYLAARPWLTAVVVPDAGAVYRIDAGRPGAARTLTRGVSA
ncbi:MAG TPA: FAD:protein FMN transferase [Gaiellales bacterium]|jgi:thiamine biosynthesis lipoprotein|nr:FAD:protein FMN transferase [Gaiellales bacterium]